MMTSPYREPVYNGYCECVVCGRLHDYYRSIKHPSGVGSVSVCEHCLDWYDRRLVEFTPLCMGYINGYGPTRPTEASIHYTIELYWDARGHKGMMLELRHWINKHKYRYIRKSDGGGTYSGVMQYGPRDGYFGPISRCWWLVLFGG